METLLVLFLHNSRNQNVILTVKVKKLLNAVTPQTGPSANNDIALCIWTAAVKINSRGARTFDDSSAPTTMQTLINIYIPICTYIYVHKGLN